ncbi:molybdopterin synthase subunit MoaE [Jatrophihabitans sp. GAS493]|uniref:molybdenum cofactor biosynthesis protein MoaE n=1 Tax=Jatrophihabitans sp. GAS493 TaxID=1907575 RepID=UPI000BB7E620|nr:molybdenum cofactor biosynthesis protein MoaE [Jatrophihabitans sp. GAS493]SOD72500.1 molybdopterin synthase subunit MoaE [Jatrophihabitans sp. GAS493]
MTDNGSPGQESLAAGRVEIAVVTDAVLDVGAHEKAVLRSGAGAHVVFSGVVRDRDHNRAVVALEYEVHPTAEAVLRGVAEQFAAEPAVHAIAVSHRYGPLKVGDVALVAAVSCAHRREAFEVCARLVDEVKRQLPIWKRQVFADGTDEWVNCA